MTRQVRIPPLSFRDFITQLSLASQRFNFNETGHSQRLARQCLLVLNENLKEGIPGTGYLIKDEVVIPGIPEIAEDQIPEEVWYAYRFWPDHIFDVEIPIPAEFIIALRDLLSTEIVIRDHHCEGKLQNLHEVQEWLQAFQNAAIQFKPSFNLIACFAERSGSY